jgi:hypothetical protein
LARASSANAASISAALRAFWTTSCIRSRAAPSFESACSAATLGLSGFISNPTRAIRGERSCSSCTRFAPSWFGTNAMPVRLPPGRLKLATNPKRTGSPPIVKTTGTVLLAPWAARAEATSPVAAMAMTPFATSSAASAGSAW